MSGNYRFARIFVILGIWLLVLGCNLSQSSNNCSSSDDCSEDGETDDLIADPDQIARPEEVIIKDSEGRELFKIFKTEVANYQFASFLAEFRVKTAEISDGESNDCHLDNGKVALCYQFTGSGIPTLNTEGEIVYGGTASIEDEDYFIVPDSNSTKPVTYVSWYAAHYFCNAIGRRLPTESEWERAASGGTNKTYPWGEKEPDCDLANFFIDLEDKLSFCENDSVDIYGETYQNGQSIDGVFHLAGNVAEWTSTFIEEDDDMDEIDRKRIVKGGSWFDPSENLTIQSRSEVLPQQTLPTVGFRCVKSL